jgi:hypothetical protein
MNAAVLTHVLSTNSYTDTLFQGFFTPDTDLPKKFKKPALFVLNTDESEGPGEHWCIVFLWNKNMCEFFDSYGMSPSLYKFDSILLKYANRLIFNEFRVQGSQPTCGHHCLFYAINRCMGKSRENILEQMYSASDLAKNDRLVYNYIMRKYGTVFSQFSI